MESTLTLYKKCEILPQRNFRIDDIEDYLATLDSVVISNYQYQRIELEKEFKIDISQIYQEPFEANNYNYAKIQNDDGKVLYFFITAKKQRAIKTIAFSAFLDTANSFLPDEDFEISNKTHISRQHKDRFIPMSSTTTQAATILMTATTFSEEGYGQYNYHWYDQVEINVTANTRLANVDVYFQQSQQDMECTGWYDRINNKIVLQLWAYQRTTENISVGYRFFYYNQVRRNVDEYSEGLTPVLYKRDSKILEQENRQNWFLVYRNAQTIDPSAYNIVNPVDCYVVPEYKIELKSIFLPLEITYNDLEEEYMYLTYSLNEYDTTYQLLDNYNNELWSGELYRPYFIGNYQLYEILEIKKLGAYLQCRKLLCTYNVDSKVTTIINLGTIYNVEKVLVFNVKSTLGVYSIDTIISESNIEDMEVTQVFNITATTTTFYGIDTIDRTDAQLIKIIELPYCPLQIVDGTIGNYYYTIDTYNTASLKLVNTSQKYNYSFVVEDVDSPLKPLAPFSKTPISTDLRSIDNESKLYHGDFYAPKFVYDSFGKMFNLEKVDYEKFSLEYKNAFYINYVVTSTMNSRFAFIFPDYLLNLSNEDFDNVVSVARNNNITLYNSQYINYLRTSYNYDVLNKEITKQNAGVSIAAQSIGAVGSIVMAAATQNPFAYASAIYASVNAIQGLVSSVNTIAASEASFEAKQKQERNQAISIAGSDDVDIMVAYSKNRAYLNYYSVSDRLKNALYNLFFLSGYATDEFGIPNLTSRNRFNFVSCELVLKQTNNLPDEIINDLQNRYRYLTVIHHYNNEWDFEQQYENWETSLGG